MTTDTCTTIGDRIGLLRCKARLAADFPDFTLSPDEAAELEHLEAGLARLARAVLRLDSKRRA